MSSKGKPDSAQSLVVNKAEKQKFALHQSKNKLSQEKNNQVMLSFYS
jgi:hypothetical protein